MPLGVDPISRDPRDRWGEDLAKSSVIGAGLAGAGARSISEEAAGQYAQARAAQEGALGMYAQMAQGAGPSLAREQLQAQSERNIASQMALAAQGRGGNLAGASRQAAMSGAAAQAQTNQQMAQLRAQEQLAAMQGYAGIAGQMAGQDIRRELGQAGIGAQYSGQAIGGVTDYETARMQAQVQQDEYKRRFGLDLGKSIGEGVGKLAQAVAMSDVRAKTDISRLDSQDLGDALSGTEAAAAADALGQVTPYQYQYRDGMGPEGDQIGVMAQDLLAAGDPAAQIVRDTPDGYGIDLGGASSLALAASADQEQRIRELESELERQGLAFKDVVEEDEDESGMIPGEVMSYLG